MHLFFFVLCREFEEDRKKTNVLIGFLAEAGAGGAGQGVGTGGDGGKVGGSQEHGGDLGHGRDGCGHDSLETTGVCVFVVAWVW